MSACKLFTFSVNDRLGGFVEEAFISELLFKSSNLSLLLDYLLIKPCFFCCQINKLRNSDKDSGFINDKLDSAFGSSINICFRNGTNMIESSQTF